MNSYIDGNTKLTGLLGSPVSHSISPLMHNEAFKQLGLNYVYLCFDVDTSNLKTAIEGLRTIGVAGFNCTYPDKVEMFHLADELSPAAMMSEAVNTVVNVDGRFIGHNTDGIGYMQSVKDAGYDIIGKEMTLLGAGGAATSIAVQAAIDGVKTLNIFARKSGSWSRAEALVHRIKENTNCNVQLFDLADTSTLKECVHKSAILTNGTNVGMAPNTDESIITDLDVFHKDLIVSDIIYNPRETKFMRLAKQVTPHVFNGMYMLLYQGSEAFKLWTGEDMPVDIIKKKYFS